MRALLILAATAILAIGCGKADDGAAATTTTGTTGASTTGSTTTTAAGPAPAGNYVAVQAVFSANCTKCHGDGRPKAGIDLSNYDGVMKGGREGAIVVAGDPTKSKIIMALRGQGAKQMPPRGALSPGDIGKVEAWIKDGAKNG